ncbi:MAG TPA: DinB family protein [Acidobacteriaceae bacterium]
MSEMPEPWMRGTHEELDPLRRAVVHALELAEEDVTKWCGELTDAAMSARPAGLPPVAFHLRHIARSLDRLLTYAEDRWLDDEQLAALKTELDPGTAVEVLTEFREGIITAKQRVRDIPPKRFDEPRAIGRKRLPTNVGGLLIHCAEHTARHVGQAVTTVKVERASRTLEFPQSS